MQADRNRYDTPGADLRIAIVTQGFFIGGGVPSVTRWLSHGLREYGHTVDIHDLATASSDEASRRIVRPLSWRRATLKGSYEPVLGVQHWGANVVEVETMRYRPRRELTRCLSDYDLIQVVAGGAALGTAVVSAGPPVYLQVATRLEWERKARRAYLRTPARLWSDAMTKSATLLESRVYPAVDGVLVENREMFRYVREAGQNRVKLAPPGIDTNRFRPAAAGWSKHGYLLSVCRLSEPRKRLDRLIAAYRELNRMLSSPPRLVLAGSGRLPQDLHRKIEAAKFSDQVVIRSDVAAADLPQLYAGACAYLQTSDEEGLGISVLEAMASGLPVIATDTAGSRECIVDGRTGWLVSLDDAEISTRLAERVALVLTGAGADMAAHARARCVAEFSNLQAIDRFLSFYDRRSE